MSNNIGKNELNNFFIQKFHTNKVSFEDAKKLGINIEEFKDADSNDDNSFDLDEIVDSKELYAAFTAIVEEDNELANTKDKEKEKEETNRVQKKGDAENK